MMSSSVSFEKFSEIVANSLFVDQSQISRETHFINDLAVDSIRLVELYLSFQDLGLEIPSDAVWQIQTVGDAYDYYLNGKTS